MRWQRGRWTRAVLLLHGLRSRCTLARAASRRGARGFRASPPSASGYSPGGGPSRRRAELLHFDRWSRRTRARSRRRAGNGARAFHLAGQRLGGGRHAWGRARTASRKARFDHRAVAARIPNDLQPSAPNCPTASEASLAPPPRIPVARRTQRSCSTTARAGCARRWTRARAGRRAGRENLYVLGQPQGDEAALPGTGRARRDPRAARDDQGCRRCSLGGRCRRQVGSGRGMDAGFRRRAVIIRGVRRVVGHFTADQAQEQVKTVAGIWRSIPFRGVRRPVERASWKHYLPGTELGYRWLHNPPCASISNLMEAHPSLTAWRSATARHRTRSGLGTRCVYDLAKAFRFSTQEGAP